MKEAHCTDHLASELLAHTTAQQETILGNDGGRPRGEAEGREMFSSRDTTALWPCLTGESADDTTLLTETDRAR